MQYDSYKVQAILNEIDGDNHRPDQPRRRAGGQSKIAEHGVLAFRTVTCRSWWTCPACATAGTSAVRSRRTQIAPTILSLLGLNPQALRAVQIERTRVLPGLAGGGIG